MDVALDVAGKTNGDFPQIIHFYRVFHYKPSILGYPYVWKHPNEHKGILQNYMAHHGPKNPSIGFIKCLLLQS